MSLPPAVLAALAAAASAWSAAAADRAGSTFLGAGFGHMRAAQTDTGVRTHVTPSAGTVALGIPESFESPGIGLAPQPANTLVLTLGHFVTDDVVVLAELGVPPEVAVEGTGVASPPGPSGALFQLDLSDPAINPLGTQRQWSPVLAARHYFGEPGEPFRPFLGAGFTYTWFTQERLNPAFERALDQRFGQPLALAAGKPGPTRYALRVDSLWAWSLSFGGRFALGERWGLTGSVAYAPLDIEATVTMRAEDGSTLATSRTRLAVEGLIGTLALDYRFGAAETGAP